jgi:hypothetical protein
MTIARHGGDVGCYWINHVDRMMQDYPKTKFVCLKRSRDDTVKSWVRRFRGSERFGLFVFHQDPDGRIRAPLMFPDYGDIPIREAAERYWDDYYREAARLEEEYPNNFRIFGMDRVLNSRRGRRGMLRFAGLPGSVTSKAHANQGGKKDPELGNALREVVGWLVKNEDVYRGTRATITPEPGSKLGLAAVAAGLSEAETDEIVMDFTSLGSSMSTFDYDMISSARFANRLDPDKSHVLNGGV